MSLRVLPAHNIPVVDPVEVIDADKAFHQIIGGHKKGRPAEFNTMLFDFGRFSYQIGRQYLPKGVGDKTFLFE